MLLIMKGKDKEEAMAKASAPAAPRDTTPSNKDCTLE
jgi:hypothetical protein